MYKESLNFVISFNLEFEERIVYSVDKIAHRNYHIYVNVYSLIENDYHVTPII